MKKHPESHLDHGLSEPQIAHLLNLFSDRSAFFVETVELPPELGTVLCGLHGPEMGDEPIGEEEVIYENRGTRAYPSRLCDRGARPTRLVTVVAGPHDGEPCILYTAYAGPVAPQEPTDPGCRDLPTAQAFWSQHALTI